MVAVSITYTFFLGEGDHYAMQNNFGSFLMKHTHTDTILAIVIYLSEMAI